MVVFDSLGPVPVVSLKQDAAVDKSITKLEKKEMFGMADIKIAQDVQKEIDAEAESDSL